MRNASLRSSLSTEETLSTWEQTLATETWVALTIVFVFAGLILGLAVFKECHDCIANRKRNRNSKEELGISIEQQTDKEEILDQNETATTNRLRSVEVQCSCGRSTLVHWLDVLVVSR